MERQLTIKDQFNTIKPRFTELLDEKTFNKEVSFALQHISKNGQLQKSTMESNLQAVLNIAQVGLSLNPVLKQAYLVPRSVKKGNAWITETHLEPSYQGLCKLVTDTGSAKSIVAQLVYKGDVFEVSLGTETNVKHLPKFESKDITHAYMIATLSDGSKMVEVMTYDDLQEIRERSESFKAYKNGKLKSCVWVTDEGEMCRKTVLRRGIKYLPKTEMWDKLGTAVNLDELDYKATDNQIVMIEGLLNTSIIDHDEREWIEKELPTASQERARELIEYLQNNQQDAIQSGVNYSQTDIKNKLNNEVK